MTQTVKMIRDDKAADVHPAEVENWRAAGWSVVEPKQRKKRERNGIDGDRAGQERDSPL